MNTSATISPCGLYRYNLVREWDISLPRVLFIMLNPSTADETRDDPTIRRCVGLAKNWGYGSIEVCNLFAYRATNPRELLLVDEPIGMENDRYILEAVERAALVIAAWGAKGTFASRNKRVIEMIYKKCTVFCLDNTKGGHPKHPLYVSNAIRPKIYLRAGDAAS